MHTPHAASQVLSVQLPHALSLRSRLKFSLSLCSLAGMGLYHPAAGWGGAMHRLGRDSWLKGLLAVRRGRLRGGDTDCGRRGPSPSVIDGGRAAATGLNN